MDVKISATLCGLLCTPIFNNANLLIIANDWYRYESIDLSQLKKLKDKIVIDPFNLLRNINFNKYGINHIILGNVN